MLDVGGNGLGICIPANGTGVSNRALYGNIGLIDFTGIPRMRGTLCNRLGFGFTANSTCIRRFACFCASCLTRHITAVPRMFGTRLGLIVAASC